MYVMLAHLSIRVQKVLQRGEKKTQIQSHALVFVRVCVWESRVKRGLVDVFHTFFHKSV